MIIMIFTTEPWGVCGNDLLPITALFFSLSLSLPPSETPSVTGCCAPGCGFDCPGKTCFGLEPENIEPIDPEVIQRLKVKP